MKRTLIALSVAGPLLLSGCVISVHDGEVDGVYSADWQDREYNNRKHISNLKLGMEYQDVKRKMGVADFNELVASDDQEIRVLYYRTQRTRDDGITTKDECTPLVFTDNLLTGWGESALVKL